MCFSVAELLRFCSNIHPEQKWPSVWFQGNKSPEFTLRWSSASVLSLLFWTELLSSTHPCFASFARAQWFPCEIGGWLVLAAVVQPGLVWQAGGRGRRVQSSRFLSWEPMTVPRFSEAYDSQEGTVPQKKQQSGVGSSGVNAVPSYLQLG